jgi:hypothetical protein
MLNNVWWEVVAARALLGAPKSCVSCQVHAHCKIPNRAFIYTI